MDGLDFVGADFLTQPQSMSKKPFLVLALGAGILGVLGYFAFKYVKGL